MIDPADRGSARAQRRDDRAWGAEALTLAALPLALAAALLALVAWPHPANTIRDNSMGSDERLSIERVELGDDGIILTVVNEGPDSLTIAQVQVNEEYRSFTSDKGETLNHVQRARLTVPYPWMKADTHIVRVVTSNGATFDRTIDVAALTLQMDWHFLGLFTLIDLCVGMIPVVILIWFPRAARVGRRGLDLLLAWTVGVLVFLIIHGSTDGLEVAEAVIAVGAILIYLAFNATRRWLNGHENDRGAGGWMLPLRSRSTRPPLGPS